MPRLVFIDKHFDGRTYELTVEKTTVGRADHNTLVLHGDSVSADHCEILFNGPEIILREHGSRNGTFVNDVRIIGQMPVKCGQVVRFGSVEARLELDPPTAEDDTAAESAVFEHRRLMAQKLLAEKMPKPASPAVTLDDGSLSASVDHTVTFSSPVQPMTAPAAEPEAARNRAGRRPIKRFILVTLLAAVIGSSLLVLAWLWWTDK